MSDRETYLIEKKRRLLEKMRAKTNSMASIEKEIFRQRQVLFRKSQLLGQVKLDYKQVDRELYYIQHPPTTVEEAVAQIRDLYGSEAVQPFLDDLKARKEKANAKKEKKP